MAQNIQHQTWLFDKLRDRHFWFWNIRQHIHKDIESKGDCCFNHNIGHIVGLPKKNGLEKPIFDYEGIIFDRLPIHRSN